MAKRKRRPIALFEVISKSHSSSRDERRAAPALGKTPASKLLTTPKWWFKRDADQPVPETPPPAAAPAPVITSASTESAVAVIAPPAPASLIAERIIPEPAVNHTAEYDHDDDSTDEPALHDPVFDHERAQTMHVAVDPERRQIALRMSYTAAIVGGFAAVVIVVLSIIVGQRMSHSGVPLLASSTTNELRAGPANPAVLDPVTPRRAAQQSAAQQASAKAQALSSPNDRAAVNSAESHTVQPAPAPTPPPETTRYVGLNYIIVQSYPESEEKLAKDTADFLTKKGYPCTVVHDVKGFMKLSVVTLQGFDKQSSPNFKNYVAKISALSNEFTGSNRSYKTFTPVGKKWDRQD